MHIHIINGKIKNVYLFYRFLPKFCRFVLLRSYTRHVKKNIRAYYKILLI